MRIVGSRCQCRRNLSRMMCIIIYNGKSVKLSLLLETTVRSVKSKKRLGVYVRPDTEVDSNCNGCKAVVYIMDTRNTERDTSAFL